MTWPAWAGSLRQTPPPVLHQPARAHASHHRLRRDLRQCTGPGGELAASMTGVCPRVLMIISIMNDMGQTRELRKVKMTNRKHDDATSDWLQGIHPRWVHHRRFSALANISRGEGPRGRHGQGRRGVLFLAVACRKHSLSSLHTRFPLLLRTEL